jgi:hypothetical protein
MQINVPSPSLQSLSGYRTYAVLAGGAIVIALNHFDLLPPGYVNLDPANWINDEFKLLLGATGRAAIASLPQLTAQHTVAAQKKAVAQGTLPAAPPFVPGGGGDA